MNRHTFAFIIDEIGKFRDHTTREIKNLHFQPDEEFKDLDGNPALESYFLLTCFTGNLECVVKILDLGYILEKERIRLICIGVFYFEQIEVMRYLLDSDILKPEDEIEESITLHHFAGMICSYFYLAKNENIRKKMDILMLILSDSTKIFYPHMWRYLHNCCFYIGLHLGLYDVVKTYISYGAYSDDYPFDILQDSLKMTPVPGILACHKNKHYQVLRLALQEKKLVKNYLGYQTIYPKESNLVRRFIQTDRLIEICIGLSSLNLPVLQILEIIMWNEIYMNWWNLSKSNPGERICWDQPENLTYSDRWDLAKFIKHYNFDK